MEYRIVWVAVEVRMWQAGTRVGLYAVPRAPVAVMRQVFDHKRVELLVDFGDFMSDN